VTAAIGGTPLVALDRLAAGLAPRLVAKLEHMTRVDRSRTASPCR